MTQPKWIFLFITVIYFITILFVEIRARRIASQARSRRQRSDPFGGSYSSDPFAALAGTGSSYTPSSSHRRAAPITGSPRRTLLRLSGLAILVLITGIAFVEPWTMLGIDHGDTTTTVNVSPGLTLASRYLEFPEDEPLPTLSRLQSQYDYDEAGNLTSHTTPNGDQTTLSYDALNRVTEITYPGDNHVTLAYDAVGFRTELRDPEGTTQYLYDIHGRITRVDDPNGSAITYEYEPRGFLSQLTYTDSAGQRQSIGYEWNTDGQLTSISHSKTAQAVRYAYDQRGNLAQRTLPNGIQTKYTYDQSNFLTSIRHELNGSLILEISYTYDTMGNRKQESRRATGEASQVTQYDYDDFNRLTRVEYSDGEIVHYTYDASDNRVSMTSTRYGETTYTYASGGQLVSVEDQQGMTLFQFDRNGKLIEQTGPAGSLFYDWDYAGRLSTVQRGSESRTTPIAAYRYDGDGRRLSMTTNGQTTTYVQHGQQIPQVLAEQSGANTVHLLPGLPHIGQIDGAQTLYYLEDGIGSVIGLTDQHGQLLETLTYDAFGALRTPATIMPRVGFAGEQFDTSTGLIYLRNRYYDPALGRFISADDQPVTYGSLRPINAYGYPQNNPINYTAPTGEKDGLFWREVLPYPPPMPLPYPPRQYDDVLWSGQGIKPHQPEITVGIKGLDTPLGPPRSDQVQSGVGLPGLPLPGYVSDATGVFQLWEQLAATAINPINAQAFATMRDMSPSMRMTPYWLTGEDRTMLLPGMTPDEIGQTLIEQLVTDTLPLPYTPTPYTRGGISLSQVADALAGMNDIVGATYDPQSGQIVIIGQQRDDWPPLNPDDLAVALQLIKSGEQASVSIEPCQPDNQDGCMKVHYNDRFVDPNGNSAAWITYTAGGQLVEAPTPSTWETHLGHVLFESDRYLKTISMGMDNITGQQVAVNVTGYTSELDLMAVQATSNSNYTPTTNTSCLAQNATSSTSASACHRMWFVAQDDVPQADDDEYSVTMRISDDKMSVQFAPVMIQVNARFVLIDSVGRMVDVPGNDPAVDEFVTFVNGNYAALANQKVELAELTQVAKFVALAQWMDDYGIPIDLEWVSNYDTQFVATPQTTPAITAQTNGAPGQVLGLYGGVDLTRPIRYVPGGDPLNALMQSALEARKSIGQASWEFTHQNVPYQAAAVNTAPGPALGGYQIEQEDIHMLVPGALPFTLSRSYNSLKADQKSAWGRGWELQIESLTSRRVPVPGDPLQYHTEFVLNLGSEEIVFTLTTDGIFLPAGVHQGRGIIGFTLPEDPYTVYPLQDDYHIEPGGPNQPIRIVNSAGIPINIGGFALVQDDITLTFNSNGQLIGKRDNSGAEITISYNANGDPTTFQHSSGQWINIDYHSVTSLATTITTSQGQHREYQYNDDYLIGVSDGSQSLLNYGYEPGDGSARRMTDITDGTGRVLAQNEYDPDGRVVGTYYRGQYLTKGYGSSRGEYFTNAAGQQVVREYTDDYRLRAENSDWGRTFALRYDNEGLLVDVTDHDGKTTTLNYTNDNLSQLIAPDGSTQQFLDHGTDAWPRFVVNPVDHIVLVDYGPNGRAVNFQTGMRLQEITANGSLKMTEVSPTSFTLGYNPDNTLNHVRFADGAQVNYARSTTGELTGIRQSSGNSIFIETNQNGWPSSVVYGDNDIEDYEIRFEYTANNEVQHIRLPNGSFTYNYEEGLLTTFTDAAGNIYHFEYGDDQSLTTEPGGLVTTHNGNTIAIALPDGGRLEFMVDENGNITQSTLLMVPPATYQSASWLTNGDYLNGLAIDLFAESKDMR